MKLTIKEGSENYTGVVVSIKNEQTIPGKDKIVVTNIFGNDVIISKDTKPGAMGIYFNCGTQLSADFLSKNNLYRHSELNSDKSKAGFFEDSGRVKALKLGSIISTGFWIPIESLSYITKENFLEYAEFTDINGVEVCKKFPVKEKQISVSKSEDEKIANRYKKLIPNQFRFHTNTSHLAKNVEMLDEATIISLTNKIHGSSAVFANIRVKRNLSFIEKLAKKIGIAVVEHEYGHVYASRKVIKSVNINDGFLDHYYGEDIWTATGENVKDKIELGITLYGEIAGFTKSGKAIQGGYDYGNRPCQNTFYVYRITYTRENGEIIEFSWEQIKEYCKKYELKHVPEFYHGNLRDFYILNNIGNPDEDKNREKLLTFLSTAYNMEKDCTLCVNKVPAEGIVFRLDGKSQFHAYKFKSKRFTLRESDLMGKTENMEDEN